MRKNIFIILILVLFCPTGFAQNEELYSRLRAMQDLNITFYNVDGIGFSKQATFLDFNEKNLKKVYRKYKIISKDLKTTDSGIEQSNIKIIKRKNVEGALTAVNVYYFLENVDNLIDIYWFGYYSQTDKNFEHKMIELISKNKIPKSSFSSLKTEKINFAGRDIKLGGNCKWMNINNIQCPYNGQMNWSLHQSKESADFSIQNQLNATKLKNGGKIVSEEQVNIIFEGTPTKAKKVIYDFTGITSILASMSGGKNLTIFYVSEKVRENYVSCVLSFWNNDNINPSGLPPLLEEVMKISVE